MRIKNVPLVISDHFLNAMSPRLPNVADEDNTMRSKSQLNLLKRGEHAWGCHLSAMIWMIWVPFSSVATNTFNYTLSGTLEVRYPDLRLKPSYYSFNIEVQGSNWVISSIPIGHKMEAAAEWLDAHFDGRIYSLTKYSETALTQLGRTSPMDNTLNNTASALVHPGPQPVAISSLISKISLLWLGYASESVLVNGRVQLNPVWEIPTVEGMVDAYVEKHERPPHLPARVVFLQTNRHPETIASLGMSVSNFLYEVTSWTTVGGLDFPAEFRAERYAQRKSGLTLRAGYRGVLTNLSIHDHRALTLPNPPKSTIVSDYSRTTNASQYFEYMSEDGDYKTFAAADLLHPKTHVPMPSGKPDRAKAIRRATIVGMVCTTLFSLALLARKSGQHKTNNK
jgi:hypothetical protein